MISRVFEPARRRPAQREAAAAAAFVSQMVNLRYGRQDELESDGLGVRLMSEAGYELDRTETFLPRDTIYICKSKKGTDAFS